MHMDISKEKLKKLYHEKNMSLSEIGEKYDCDSTNIHYYMKKYDIERRNLKEAQKIVGDSGARKTNRPNLDLSEDVSYILGVLEGDGFTLKFEERNESIIRLQVNDYPFAKSFSKSLKNIGLNPSILNTEKYGNTSTKWRVSAYSQKFLDWYNSISILNFLNKSKEVENNFMEFFRGFYESDGTLSIQPEKSYFQLFITNSNKKILEKIKNLMLKIGYNFTLNKKTKRNEIREINGRKIKFKKPVYRLTLHRRKEIEKLLSKLNVSIPRKSIKRFRKARAGGDD